MNANLNVVFEEAQPGMTVILQEKTEKWSGIIESKWGKLRDLQSIFNYFFLKHLSGPES